MIRASFCHLLRAVPTDTTLFDKWNNLFTVKIFKTTCRLGGCRIPDALYLENLEGEIYNCALLLNSLAFFRYTTRIPLFSRVSSIDLLLYKYQCIGIAITYLFTHWLSCDLLMYLSTNSIIFLSFYLSSYVNSEKKKKKRQNNFPIIQSNPSVMCCKHHYVPSLIFVSQLPRENWKHDVIIRRTLWIVYELCRQDMLWIFNVH